MRLHQYISSLQQMPQSTPIHLSDGRPAGPLDSYRGFYNQLAVTINREPFTVQEALRDARRAVGGVFQGYKGGDYVMSGDTPVWVSDYGDCEELGIRNLEVTIDGDVIINTFDASDYMGF